MSLLLEALKRAERTKQANAARQDAGTPPSVAAAVDPSPAAEPSETFDLSELTLAPPRESAAPEETLRETAFPEISLIEPEPAEMPGAAAPLEIPAWTPPEPELTTTEPPALVPAAETATPVPAAPDIGLSLDLPESPPEKIEPLLTLDFPQAEPAPEALPEPASLQEKPLRPEPAPRPPEAPALAAEWQPAASPQPAPEPATAAPFIPPPPAPEPATPVRPAAASAPTSGAEMAKKILAAGRGKSASNPKWLGGILLVSILAGAAGYTYYQQMLAQPGIGFQLPPPVEQAPLAPPSETPVAPPAEPPAEPPAATPAETPPAPEQAAHVAEKTAEKPAPPPEVPARVPKKAAEKSAVPPSADTLSGSISAATPSSAPPSAPAKPVADANVGVADSGIKIRRDSGAVRLDPLLAGAWQAYMAGDTARAENDYRRVLKQQPNSRDALLGLAAIAAGRGQPNEAAALYQQILQLDPRDAAAQAGLIGLRGYSEPNASESRLKILLGQSPDAGYLHFALGNLYAHQSRWPEAQEAYFNALHSDASNADYAFNLAVSLDHLDQHRLALEYYRRALDLAAQGKAAGFDRARAKNRIQELLPPLRE